MAKKLMMAILILLSICLFTSCSLGENSLYAFFADWQEEQDSCVAVFDESTGCVTFGEKTVDLYSVLDNYYENSKSGSVLAEYEGKIFGIHRYGFKNEQYYETIDVYALDIETQSIEILHTKDYCPRQVADDESVWRQTKFYYSNHYVVLCDGVVMTRVNIETGVVEEFLPDTFSYPNEKYTVEYVTDFDGKKDCEKVKIIGEDLEREVSLEYMAQKKCTCQFASRA